MPMAGRESIYLRVDPKLKDFLVASASVNRKTLNTFCVDILSDRRKIKTLIAIEKSNHEIANLFSKMGVNINQLARHCNSTGEAATPEQLLQILEEAKAMQKEILTAFAKKEGG
ncbi:MAG: plasmid mobilization relaxosome protein MobC [Phascolarctobacterium sp.]|nr:plasmid mobilization relaxosome protein MobC [Phascolarctobacterium sp.]